MSRLTMLLLTFGLLCAPVHSVEIDKVPTLSDTRCIYIYTKIHWSLTVFPDGSGKLSGGPLTMDSASIPKSTFDFQAIYSAIVPLLQETPSKKDVATVALGKTDWSSISLQLQEQATLTSILVQAERAAVPFDAERFSLLLQRRPLPK